MMADVIVDRNFPGESLVPKNETGALNFLKKYPEYNGDGVTIAILDSGVDPKATGLERTPDGAVKVIERFDCSGCGDVDTSRKVVASPDGTITGLSGRKIELTEAIKRENIGNEYSIGLKSLHDLYPSVINDKINADLKLKTWDEKQKKALAEQSRRITEFENANSAAQSLPLKDKLRKDDLDHGLEVLQSFDKQYSDFKTSYDCILYKTKNGWRCVIDVAQGDLEKAIVLGEYSQTHDIKSIDDFLSISVNVHDDGNVLEIVGMCSSHGTHVASIASGNQSACNKCEMDGVAPGAKIVSLTIGDGRLGSMETGTAIIRALIKIMELCNAGKRVHLINMSYGEFAHWSNTGRVGELMNEVINDYGVIWIASAGNHGPALCTIGTPPDISQPSCIGVGAYVSPEMMEAEYSLREKLPGNVYTWTSRDPCVDGGQGVTVCAPGAAITSVPEFTLNRQQLMNGTSMSAPHVCGAVALLISGLLKSSIDYSPYSIKRALWNTATRLSYVDPFAQGNGLLNVEKAYEHLVKFHDRNERDVRFLVSVGAQNAKGIHVRSKVLTKPEEFNVTVQPAFQREKYCAPKCKIDFNLRLTLVPSAPWVQCGSFLDLCYSARSFVVKIDPTGLKAGVHTAQIRAYESGDIEKGTVFEVPITIVQPMALDETSNWQIQFDDTVCKPNTILRHFVQVPNNATWAVLKLRSSDTVRSTQAKFLIHTMQILPQKFCKTLETQKILPVSPESETLHYFKVEPNNIVEVCIAKYWSNFGDTVLKSSLEFHGVRANVPNALVHGASGIHRLDIQALANEDANPTVQLKSALMVLKPSETKISALSQRDVLPHGRQIYQNLLTYNLNLSKSQEVAFAFPLLTSVLYESEFESQLWMCFDANKKLVACGDAYSACNKANGNSTNFTKLSKGDYVVRVQVRHEKRESLEKLNEATLSAFFKLSSALAVDLYGTYKAAILGEKKFNASTVSSAAPVPLYAAPISNEKLTKAGYPSQCASLLGTIVIAKDEAARKVDVNNFEYILPDGPSVSNKKNGNSKSNGKETKSKLDEYKEGLRDYQNSQLSKLDIADAEEIYSNIIKDFPTYLVAHISLIQKFELAETKNSLPLTAAKSTAEKADQSGAAKSVLKRIVDLADVVINATNTDTLLAYYGLKTDNRADAAKIKTEMDKQKAILLDAYVRKAIALGKIGLIDAQASAKAHNTDEIDSIYAEVGKFIDYNDSKVIYLSLWHAFVHQHYGRMMKILQKIYEEKAQREILTELQLVVKELNWNHIGDVIQKKILFDFPSAYRLF